ncbi:MAG: aldehyde dehydrogenase family protein [Verrucomicrobiae bacterium]|nr:aldehyde dehydrogenase family protein [Verrucomicrobiae bacterium]
MSHSIGENVSTVLPFIDGNYRKPPGGRTNILINPTTENQLAEVTEAGASETAAAIESAFTAWKDRWGNLPGDRRAAMLHEIARSIRARATELATLETLNIGKPISNATKDIEAGARLFEYYAGAIDKFCGQTITVPGGGLDFTIHEPFGVVVCIVPWSAPFLVACRKIAPALAAGNTVVLKPSGLSPLTALKLGELAFAAGLPSGALQVVVGTGSFLGDVLVTHPLVRKVSFTGSTEVGRRIMQMAAGDLKRISLEVRGKSLNIVFGDSDWKCVAETSALHAFANAGQDPYAYSKVFVERKIFEMFLEQFVESTKRLIVGDPTDQATDVGPLVSGRRRELVEEFLDDARAHGSRFVCGGARPFARGFFLAPTVLTGVGHGDRCWREEIFGPVLSITPFDDESSLISDVNDARHGMSAAIWTNDLRRAFRIARAIKRELVSVNAHPKIRPEITFGGFNRNCSGQYLAMTALSTFSEVKNVYVAE